MPSSFGTGLAEGLIGGWSKQQAQQDDLKRQEKQNQIQNNLAIINARDVPDDVRQNAAQQLQDLMQGKKPGGKSQGGLSPVLKNLLHMVGKSHEAMGGQQQTSPQMPGSYTGQASNERNGGTSAPAGNAPDVPTPRQAQAPAPQQPAGATAPAPGGVSTATQAAAPQGQQEPYQQLLQYYDGQLADIDRQAKTAQWPASNRLRDQKDEIVKQKTTAVVKHFESSQTGADATAQARRLRRDAIDDMTDAQKAGDITPEELHQGIVHLFNAGETTGLEQRNIPGSSLTGKDPRTGKPWVDFAGNPIDPSLHYDMDGKTQKLYPVASKEETLPPGIKNRYDIEKILNDPKSSPELRKAAVDAKKDLALNEQGKQERIVIEQGNVEKAAEQKTDAQAIAEAIRNGTDAPDMAGLNRTGVGAKVRAILDRQGYNLMTAERDWKAVQVHLRSLNGPQQERLRQAVSFASESIPKIEDLYDQWTQTKLPGGFRLYNSVALKAAANVPGEAGKIAQTLQTQINDLTSEMGTVYKGGNSSTDESLKLAASNLNAAWNPDQFKAAIEQLRKNLVIRQNSISTSAPQGVTPGSPYISPGQNGQNGAGGKGASTSADDYLKSIGHK